MSRKHTVISLTLAVVPSTLILLLAPVDFKILSALPLFLVTLFYVLRFLKKKAIISTIDESLLFLVIHMYGVATGKPPRKRLFELECIAGGYGEYDRVLRRIASLATRWGYGFVRAIKYTIPSIRNKVFRDFLIRLGELLAIGEDPERFLEVERRALLAEFQAQYSRLIETSKLLLGIYSSSISSATFMAITMLIFMMLMGGSIQILVATYIAVIASLTVLTYVLYRILPRDRLSHKLPIKPKIYKLYKRVSIISILLCLIVGMTIYINTLNYSLVMLTIACIMLIPGIVAKAVERYIKNIDNFFPIFIRSFGLTFSVVPNYQKAIQSIGRGEYGRLMTCIHRLYARLKNSVMPKVAWYYFICESFSELVRKSINIFYDTLEAGGNAARIGAVLSETCMRIIDIRKQRDQATKAFEATVYILHVILVSILMFMIKLLGMFNEMFLAMGTSVTYIPLPFQSIPLYIVEPITFVFIMAMAIINALAIKVAQGGLYETAWIPASAMLMTSGIAMYATEYIARTIFSTIIPTPTFLR